MVMIKQKYLWSLLAVVMAATMGVGFSSCGDDDEDDNSNPSSSEFPYAANSYRSYTKCPDDNHPHMIDLGLPSGTLWACCNVRADKPEAYGGYYAWGETETKSMYNRDSYVYCDSRSGICYYLGSDIAGTQYDVAHVKWGGSWVMPSHTQQKELLNNCTTQWTKKKGVNGRNFTGPNGGSIFLPAAGGRTEHDLVYVGSYGYCWSSTHYPQHLYGAYRLYFKSDSAYWNSWDHRDIGYAVRPVWLQ